MSLYLGNLPHFEIFGNGFPEKYIRYLEKFLYHQMTSWAKGTKANSLSSLITIFCWESTDYNLLFKGKEQVEICFIAYHEWIAKQWIGGK